jgi:tRNA(Met) C34 N-acetyltransferase TmcA
MTAKIVDIVKTQRLAAAARALAGKRKRKPGVLHKHGAHWYALEDYFDAHKIEAMPVKGSGFMLGTLEDMVVVEVPEHFSPAAIQGIGDSLTSIGIKALVIREGIRFLRLRAVEDQERARLDTIVATRDQQTPTEVVTDEAGP